MKITLIGATGFVGQTLLKELAERNHQVKAIARNTDKITIDASNVNKVSLDVNDTEKLADELKEQDIVISAFNPGWNNPNLYDDYLKGAASIEKAAENSGAKRLLVIGGAGTMKIDGNYIVDGKDFPKEIYPGASAVRKYFVEDLSKNEKLDWTFFSPAIEMHPGITTGRTGKYRLGSDSPVFNEENRSMLSVEDLAVAIADEAENANFIKKQFTAAY